jgi:Protein of unknown function (DUF2971)
VESWIDSYFESLRANTETGQSEALSLKRSNFPKALYRYRSLERLAYCLEELRDGYVFLSNPANFNDPHDSALSTSFEQFVNRTLALYGLRYDPDTEFAFLESSDEAEKEGRRAQREAERLALVSMFGGMLFDLSQILPALIPQIDVNNFSSPSPPKVNTDWWHTLAACQKSKEWKYEEEWRLVSLDPGGRNAPKFSLNACGIKPSRIILGTKIDQADRAAIKEIAEKISVPAIDAELAKDRFEIKF